MAPVTVKYVGEEVYSGWDGEDIVNLAAGEEAEVSEAKAAQLAEDRPHDFEIDGKPAEKRPSRKAPAEAPAAGGAPNVDELMKLNRPQLDDLAGKHGISAPSEMPNKRDVANAILAALDEQETH